jgi:hypothetical protein
LGTDEVVQSVAIVKNTFVHLLDPSEQAHKRQLRQSVSELPCSSEMRLGFSSLLPQRFAEDVPAVSSREEPQSKIGALYPWVIDAAKLNSRDRRIVSPSFRVLVGHEVASFRLILFPQGLDCDLRKATFMDTHGWGIVQLKCESSCLDESAKVSYRIWVGSGKEPFGPVCHNIAQSGISELPKGRSLLNLRAAVDPNTSTVTLCFEKVSDGALGTEPELSFSRDVQQSGVDQGVKAPFSSELQASVADQYAVGNTLSLYRQDALEWSRQLMHDLELVDLSSDVSSDESDDD